VVIVGIRFVNEQKGIYDSINCRFVEPFFLGISKEKVEAYLKDHPFPEDPAYSIESLMGDLQTTGSWTLPKDVKEETGEFIADMIQELI
jgi:hypothetical protein